MSTFEDYSAKVTPVVVAFYEDGKTDNPVIRVYNEMVYTETDDVTTLVGSRKCFEYRDAFPGRTAELNALLHTVERVIASEKEVQTLKDQMRNSLDEKDYVIRLKADRDAHVKTIGQQVTAYRKLQKENEDLKKQNQSMRTTLKLAYEAHVEPHEKDEQDEELLKLQKENEAWLLKERSRKV